MAVTRIIILLLFLLVVKGWAQPELVHEKPAMPVVNDPVTALLEKLKLPDPETRIATLNRLSRLDDPRVIPALAEAMGRGELPVRIDVVRAYRNLGAKAPLLPLLAVLRDPAPELRLEAMLTLWMRFENEAMPPEAIQAVITATRDTNFTVRYYAVDRLRYIPGPASEQALLTAVHDPNVDVRVRAISQLADVAIINANRTVADAVTTALHDENARARVAAATTLGRCRADQVTAPLLSAMQDADPDVRAAAARALTARYTPQVIDALIVAAGDREPLVRMVVIQVLRPVTDPRVGDALLALLRDPEEDVQLTTALTLARRGDARVLDYLRAAVEQRDRVRVGPVLKALGALGAPADPVLLAALRDPRPDVRERAQAMLLTHKNPALIERYLALLQDTDPALRITALRLLAPYDDPRVSEALTDAWCNGATPDIRQTAVAALRQPRTAALLPDTLNRVRNLARGNDPETCGLALALLFDSRAPQTDAIIKEVLKRPDPLLRAVAVKYAPAERLLPVSHDPDTRVRNEAVKRLGALGSRAVAPLCEIVNENNDALSSSALIALGCTRDIQAVAPLLRHATDQNGMLRLAALAGMGEMLKRRSDDALQRALSKAVMTGTRRTRTAALDAASVAGEAGIPVLCAGLSSGQLEIQQDTLRVVTGVRDSRLGPPLRVLLPQVTGPLYLQTLSALAMQADQASVDLLLTILKDSPDLAAQAAAADGLGLLRDMRAVEPLLTMLATTRSVSRPAAARALGEIADQRALPALLTAAGTNDENLRAAALHALTHFHNSRADDSLQAARCEDEDIIRAAVVHD